MEVQLCIATQVLVGLVLLAVLQGMEPPIMAVLPQSLPVLEEIAMVPAEPVQEPVGRYKIE
jgi:hypothetical protein